MTTPLMGLEEVNAGVGGDSPSTAWNKVITNFQDLDAHDHTTGNGAKITVGALNIDANLPINNHSLTEVVSAIFTNQPTALTTSYGLYVENGDLVYRSSTQKVPITSNGNSLAVVGSPGSISGMLAPQTVSYALGFYRFYQDVGLLATLQSAGITIGPETVPNATNFVTLKANPDTGYNLTFPVADPDTNKILWSSNGAGDLIWVDGLKKSGTVAANQLMLATSATDMTGLTVALNQVILGTAGTPVSGQIVDSYVSATAAIAGTKIVPNFGSQNIITTGTFSSGAMSVASLTSSGPISGTNLTATGNTISFSNSGGTFTIAPATTFNNNVTISGSNSLTVGGSATISGLAVFNNNIASNIVPDGNGTRLLGSATNRWVASVTTLNASSTSTLSGIVTFGSTINSSVSPAAHNTYDLATNAVRWRDAYFSGTANMTTMNTTTANSVTLNASGTLTVGGNANVTSNGVFGKLFSNSTVEAVQSLYAQGVNNFYYPQGAHIVWNSPITAPAGFNGGTSFVNNKGLGNGGFSWHNSTTEFGNPIPGSGNPNNPNDYRRLMHLDANGNLYTREDVYARDGRFTNKIYVNTSNTSGYGIELSDDGDIVDLNDSYCAMRFSGGVRVHSGNKSGGAVITLGSNGNISNNLTDLEGIRFNGQGVHVKMREIQGSVSENTTTTIWTAPGQVMSVTGFFRASGSFDWIPISQAANFAIPDDVTVFVEGGNGTVVRLSTGNNSSGSTWQYRLMVFYT